MLRPDALDLARAAARQLGGAPDRQSGPAQGDDALVGRRVGPPSGVLARRLGQLDALALPFAPGLVVVARHLQCQLEQQPGAATKTGNRSAFQLNLIPCCAAPGFTCSSARSMRRDVGRRPAGVVRDPAHGGSMLLLTCAAY